MPGTSYSIEDTLPNCHGKHFDAAVEACNTCAKRASCRVKFAEARGIVSTPIPPYNSLPSSSPYYNRPQYPANNTPAVDQTPRNYSIQMSGEKDPLPKQVAVNIGVSVLEAAFAEVVRFLTEYRRFYNGRQ